MNENRYLNEKGIKESISGGPAYYRQAHRAPNPMARYLAEMKQEKQEQKSKKYRLLRLKLLGRADWYIHLPSWALLGKLSA